MSHLDEKSPAFPSSPLSESGKAEPCLRRDASRQTATFPTSPVPKDNQYKLHLRVVLTIFVSVLIVDTVATYLYLISPGYKKRTWSLFCPNYLAANCICGAYYIDLRSPRFRRLLFYTLVPMVAVMSVLMVMSRLRGCTEGSSFWFELRFSAKGLDVVRCAGVETNNMKEEGEVLCYTTGFLNSKIFLHILTAACSFVQGIAIWGERR